MKTHAKQAKQYLSDEARVDWHDETLWIVRQKRDKQASQLPEWEELRNQASAIKEDTLDNLPAYLNQFQAEATANGATVIRAKDAHTFNAAILEILKAHNATKVVKSKSMLTEECHLNQYLQKNGIQVTDTDLGERIIQFRNEPPSHIVLPAIHLKKEDIGETFHQHLGTQKGASDPTYLTHEARKHLREKFLSAHAAITGVNFAVASNGTIVVCTNEGNADMGVHAAPIQIHCMGVEKIIPQMTHLGVFTKLLARNATGQAVTTYTSHYRKPRKGTQMYILILDNGRIARLQSAAYRNSLKCIRCGACLNTCPVFRKSGGHSYHHVIPGPIGSILAPHKAPADFADLPFASTLCGSCTNICPVKINIHEQLYQWRQDLFQAKNISILKRITMKTAAIFLQSNRLYNFAGTMARLALRILPRPLVYLPLNTWGAGRELPRPPKQSFKRWYKNNRTEKP